MEYPSILAFLEVDPKAFFSVKSEWADKDRPGNALEIIKAPVSGKGKSFTKEYLVSKIWSQGVFTFVLKSSILQTPHRWFLLLIFIPKIYGTLI